MALHLAKPAATAFDAAAGEHATIGRCAAHGCPGAGSLSSGSSLLCCWHDGQASHLWPEITRRVRKYRAVEHIVRAALGASSFDWQAMQAEAGAYFEKRGLRELMPQGSIRTGLGQEINETVSGGAYGYRLNSWLRRQILTDELLVPITKPGAASSAAPRRLFDSLPEAFL